MEETAAEEEMILNGGCSGAAVAHQSRKLIIRHAPGRWLFVQKPESPKGEVA
jgi:hypothetical protein